MKVILEQKQLLPLVSKVVSFVDELRSAYFYEFELANFNIALLPPKEHEATPAAKRASLTKESWRLMFVNQSIPFAYRHDFQTEVNKIYDETEYEFNDTLVLKKIASFFVSLSTGFEVESHEELIKILQDWTER